MDDKELNWPNEWVKSFKSNDINGKVLLSDYLNMNWLKAIGIMEVGHRIINLQVKKLKKLNKNMKHSPIGKMTLICHTVNWNNWK